MEDGYKRKKKAYMSQWDHKKESALIQSVKMILGHIRVFLLGQLFCQQVLQHLRFLVLVC